MFLDSNTLTLDLKIMPAFFNVCEDQRETSDNYYVLFLCDLPIPIHIKIGL